MLLLPLLLLLAAPRSNAESTGLFHRQYDNGDDVNCKELSFSGPEWYLFDPNFTMYTGGTSGDVGFSAYNIASNVSFDCYARGVDLSLPINATQWHNCSIPDAQFSFSVLTNSFGLRQTWVCDNAADLTFAANGTLDLPDPLGCNAEAAQRWCLYGNNAINPGLTSPVVIKPFGAWYPRIPYEYPERCVERSDYPTWEIHSLVYNHSSSQQSLSLTVVNIMNGGKISCVVSLNETLTRGEGHAPRWTDCVDASQVGNETFAAQILFDHDYQLLGVKQTWKCHDNVPANDEPDTYSGLGYQTIPLNCTTPQTYEGQAGGDPSSYTCSLPTTNISGYAGYDFPPQMPHTSYTHSCTMNSINSTGLVLQDYHISDDGGGGKEASFALYNPGPGDTYAISNLTVADDGQWHRCDGELPWQLVACDYALDRAAGKVGFRLQWYCDDRDPYNAILFSANATGGLPESGSGPARLNISAVSWTSSGAPMTRGPQLPWV